MTRIQAQPIPARRPTRRDFIQYSLGAGGAALASQEAFLAQSGGRQLGVALVGLGRYATGQLAPALQETRQCRLAGIVTGTPAKAKEWSQRYSIPSSHIYDYESFDRIGDNSDIDIVYVVLPNSMHAEYTIRAARAGKHVICEKPMSISVREAEKMVAACKAANRQLAIGYRLHHEPHNQEVMRLGQEQVYGPIKLIHAYFGFPLKDRSRWRLHKKMAGGGPLMDVGIYCIQAARYATGEEPVAVTAQEFKTEPEIFVDVEESLSWQMEFRSGTVANCTTSYGVSVERFEASCARGWFGLRPAYQYDGIRGMTSSGPMVFPQVREQALHMDAVAASIKAGRPNATPGEMGLQDMRIIEAIYRAASTGRRVALT